MKVYGIYIIKNTVNGKCYIGSSVDIYRRLQKHRNDLRLNKHHSYKLQGSFNKHGEEKFQFELLEQMYFPQDYKREVVFQHLECLEQHHMDIFKAYKVGYNVSPKSDRPRHGGRVAGLKSVETRRKNGTGIWTKERRELMREYGRSEAQLKHLANLRANKEIKRVYQYDLFGNYIDEFNSVQHVAEKFGYLLPSIRNSCNKNSPKCKNYIFLYEKYDKISPFVNTRTLKNRDKLGRFINK